MTKRPSLVAVLIRVGLLLALAIMLMAEHAQAQWPAGRFSAVFRAMPHAPAVAPRR